MPIMRFFKFLDAYTLRARLFPAIIAGAPALAALALLISWDKIALSNVIATGGLLVLLFTLADVARRQGRRIEPRLYESMGGKPSVTMMRRSDQTIDAHTKDRYREFLATKIGRTAPTRRRRRPIRPAPMRFMSNAGSGCATIRETRRCSASCSASW